MSELETDVYLKGLTEFTKETVKCNDSKILQMTYNRNNSVIRSFILTSYTKEANRLIAMKRPTLEQKKEILLEFVGKLKEKYPEEFAEVGWWDLKVAKEKDENN